VISWPVMRSLRRALLWASVAGFWIGCSVNQSGLSDGSLPPGDGAAAAGGGAGAPVAGHGGSGGVAGGAGTIVTGIGGTAGGAGAAGNPGTGGGVAGSTGGTDSGAGGGAGNNVTGTAGIGGTGDSAGTAGSGGDAGSTGIAGASGGDAGGGAGGSGTAGASGTGDAGTGGNGTGGGGGSAGASGGGGGNGGGGGRGGGGGGRAGSGGGNGRGGAGGNPCAAFPSAKAFTPPNDTRVHCYWTHSNSQTWSQSQQACMLQQGHLVTILSPEENDFVVSVAQFSSAFSDTWIGATDDKTGSDRSGPGTYRWVTNETWSYSNWQQGQPDGFCDPCSAGQTCTCDHRGVLASDGTWNDRWQDNGRSSVCEAP